MIRPSDCNASLMNARKKEKKKRLKEGRKPETLSSWVALAEEMIQWFKDNPTIRNFLTYAHRHGYSWTQFKRWRR